jgi:cytochrome c
MKYVLAIAAALILTACGESAESTAEATSPAPSSTTASTAAPEAAPTPEERGRKLFNECAVCHTVKEGDGNRVGPNLFGIYGSEAGLSEGFAYSKAMKESGIVWTDEALDAYIESPAAFLRGNRMAYAGQRDAQKREDIIAYLKTLK